MDRIWRRICAAVNPVSTAATRWWCHPALRRVLTGQGATARQRQFIRHRAPGAGFTLSAEQMAARAAAINDLLGRGDREP